MRFKLLIPILVLFLLLPVVTASEPTICLFEPDFCLTLDELYVKDCDSVGASEIDIEQAANYCAYDDNSYNPLQDYIIISGVVTYEDNNPAQGVEVSIQDFQVAGSVLSDLGGEYRFILLKDDVTLEGEEVYTLNFDLEGCDPKQTEFTYKENEVNTLGVTRLDCDLGQELPPAPAPACGINANIYTSIQDNYTSFNPQDFCLVGTPSPDPDDISFPQPGQTVTWTCTNDAQTISCSAENIGDPEEDVDEGQCPPEYPYYVRSCNADNTQVIETTFVCEENGDFNIQSSQTVHEVCGEGFVCILDSPGNAFCGEETDDTDPEEDDEDEEIPDPEDPGWICDPDEENYSDNVDCEYGQPDPFANSERDSCEDFGLSGGSLLCNPLCTISLDNCHTCPDEPQDCTQSMCDCPTCQNLAICQFDCSFDKEEFENSASLSRLNGVFGNELTWNLDTISCNINQIQITIKNEDDVIIQKSLANNAQSYAHTTPIEERTNYLYNVTVKFTDPENNLLTASFEKEFKSGDEVCVGQDDDFQFCRIQDNQDHLIKQCEDGLSSTNESCLSQERCIINAQGQGQCVTDEKCDLCSGLLGLYGSLNILTIGEDSICARLDLQNDRICIFEDFSSSRTSIGQLRDFPQESCYEFLTKEMCLAGPGAGESQIHDFNCQWKDYQKEFSMGVCRPTEPDLQDCQPCNENELFDGYCPQDLCELYSDNNCYYNPNPNTGSTFPITTRYSCNNIDEIGCEIYTTRESCEGDQILEIDINYNAEGLPISGDNEILQHSNDSLGFGICNWVEERDECHRDPDFKISSDIYNSPNCHFDDIKCFTDFETPNTTLLDINSSIINNHNNIFSIVQLQEIFVNATDNMYNENELKTLFSTNGAYPSKTLQELRGNLNTKYGENVTVRYFSKDPARNLEQIKEQEIIVVGKLDNPQIITGNTSWFVEEINSYLTNLSITLSPQFVPKRNMHDEEIFCRANLTSLDLDTPYNIEFSLRNTNTKFTATNLVDATYTFTGECFDNYLQRVEFTDQITINADRSIYDVLPKTFEPHNKGEFVFSLYTMDEANQCYVNRLGSGFKQQNNLILAQQEGRSPSFTSENRKTFLNLEQESYTSSGVFSLSNSQSFTMSMWFETESLIINDLLKVSRGQTEVGFELLNNNIEFKLNSESSVSAPIQNNNLYHVAGVFDADLNNVKLYLDGQLVDQTSFTGNFEITNGVLNLGSDDFEGKVASIKLYGRALSDLQIRLLSQNVLVPNGLKGEWITNQNNNAQTLIDTSGYIKLESEDGLFHSKTLYLEETGLHVFESRCEYEDGDGTYWFNGTSAHYAILPIDNMPPVLSIKQEGEDFQENHPETHEITLEFECFEHYPRLNQGSLAFGCDQDSLKYTIYTTRAEGPIHQNTINTPEFSGNGKWSLNIPSPTSMSKINTRLALNITDLGGKNSKYKDIKLNLYNPEFDWPQIEICNVGPVEECETVPITCQQGEEKQRSCEVTIPNTLDFRRNQIKINYPENQILNKSEFDVNLRNTITGKARQLTTYSDFESNNFVYTTNLLANSQYQYIINAVNDWGVEQEIKVNFEVDAPEMNIILLEPRKHGINNNEPLFAVSNESDLYLEIITSTPAQKCVYARDVSQIESQEDVINYFETVSPNQIFNNISSNIFNISIDLTDISFNPTIEDNAEELTEIFILCKPGIEEEPELENYAYKDIQIGYTTGLPNIGYRSSPNPVLDPNTRTSTISVETNQPTVCEIAPNTHNPGSVVIQPNTQNDFNKDNPNYEDFSKHHQITYRFTTAQPEENETYNFEVTCTNLAFTTNNHPNVNVSVELVSDSKPKIITPLNETTYSILPMINVTTRITDTCKYSLNNGSLQDLDTSADGLTHTASLPSGLDEDSYDLRVVCQRSIYKPEVKFTYDTTYLEIFAKKPLPRDDIGNDVFYSNTTNFELQIETIRYVDVCTYGYLGSLSQSSSQDALEQQFNSWKEFNYTDGNLSTITNLNISSISNHHANYAGDGSDSLIEFQVICFERNKYHFKEFKIGSDETTPNQLNLQSTPAQINKEDLNDDNKLKDGIEIKLDTDDYSICKITHSNIGIDNLVYSQSQLFSGLTNFSTKHTKTFNSNNDISLFNAQSIKINMTCTNPAGLKNTTTINIPVNLGVQINITSPSHPLVERPMFAISNNSILDLEIQTDVDSICKFTPNPKPAAQDFTNYFENINVNNNIGDINEFDTTHQSQINLNNYDLVDGEIDDFYIVCKPEGGEEAEVEFGYEQVKFGYIPEPPQINVGNNPNILRNPSQLVELEATTNNPASCFIQRNDDIPKNTIIEHLDFNRTITSYNGFISNHQASINFVESNFGDEDTYEFEIVCIDAANNQNSVNHAILVNPTNQQSIEINQPKKPSEIVYDNEPIPLNITTDIEAACSYEIEKSGESIAGPNSLTPSQNELNHYAQADPLEDGEYKVIFSCLGGLNGATKSRNIKVRERGPPKLTVEKPVKDYTQGLQLGYSDETTFELKLSSLDEGVCRYMVTNQPIPGDLQYAYENEYSTQNQIEFEQEALQQTIDIDVFDFIHAEYPTDGSGITFRQTHFICKDQNNEFDYTTIHVGADTTPIEITEIISPQKIIDQQNREVEITIKTDDRSLCKIQRINTGGSYSIQNNNLLDLNASSINDFTRNHKTNITVNVENNVEYKFEVTCVNAAGHEDQKEFEFKTDFQEQTLEIIKPQQFNFPPTLGVDQMDVEIKVNTTLPDICQYRYYSTQDEPEGFGSFYTTPIRRTTHEATLSGLETGEYVLQIRCNRYTDANEQRIIVDKTFIVDTSDFSVIVKEPAMDLAPEPKKYAYADADQFNLRMRTTRSVDPQSCYYGYQENIFEEGVLEEIELTSPSWRSLIITTETDSPFPRNILSKGNFKISRVHSDYKGDGTDSYKDVHIICSVDEVRYYDTIKVGSDRNPTNITQINVLPSKLEDPENKILDVLVQTNSRTLCNIKINNLQSEEYEILQKPPQTSIDDFIRGHNFKLEIMQDNLPDTLDIQAQCTNRAGVQDTKPKEVEVGLKDQKITIQSPTNIHRNEELDITITTVHQDKNCVANITNTETDQTILEAQLQPSDQNRTHTFQLQSIEEGNYKIEASCERATQEELEFEVILSPPGIWVTMPQGVGERPTYAQGDEEVFELELQVERSSSCKYSFAPYANPDAQTIYGSQSSNQFIEGTNFETNFSLNLNLNEELAGGYQYTGLERVMHVACLEEEQDGQGNPVYSYQPIMVSSNTQNFEITSTIANPGSVIDFNQPTTNITIETNQPSVCWLTVNNMPSGGSVIIPYTQREQFDETDFIPFREYEVEFAGSVTEYNYKLDLVCENKATNQETSQLEIELKLTSDSAPNIVRPPSFVPSQEFDIRVETQVLDICSYTIKDESGIEVVLSRSFEQNTPSRTHTDQQNLENGEYTLEVQCASQGSPVTRTFTVDTTSLIVDIVKPKIIGLEQIQEFKDIIYGDKDSFNVEFNSSRNINACRYGYLNTLQQNPTQTNLGNAFNSWSSNTLTINGRTITKNNFRITDIYENYEGLGGQELLRPIQIICSEGDMAEPVYRIAQFRAGSDRTRPNITSIQSNINIIEEETLQNLDIELTISTDDYSTCKVTQSNIQNFESQVQSRQSQFLETNYSNQRTIIINSDDNIENLNGQSVSFTVECENLAGLKETKTQNIPVNNGIKIGLVSPIHPLFNPPDITPNFAVANSSGTMTLQIETDVEDASCALLTKTQKEQIQSNEVSPEFMFNNIVQHIYKFNEDNILNLNMAQTYHEGQVFDTAVLCIADDVDFGLMPLKTGYITQNPEITIIADPEFVRDFESHTSNIEIESDQEIFCQDININPSTTSQGFEQNLIGYNSFVKNINGQLRFNQYAPEEFGLHTLQTICTNLAGLQSTKQINIEINLTKTQQINIMKPSQEIYPTGSIDLEIETILSDTCSVEVRDEEGEIKLTQSLTSSADGLTHQRIVTINNQGDYTLIFRCGTSSYTTKQKSIYLSDFGPPTVTVVDPKNPNIDSQTFAYSDTNPLSMTLTSSDMGECRYSVNQNFEYAQGIAQSTFNAWGARRFEFEQPNQEVELSINLPTINPPYTLDGQGQTVRDMHVICRNQENDYAYTRLRIGVDETLPEIFVDVKENIIDPEEPFTNVKIITDDRTICQIEPTQSISSNKYMVQQQELSNSITDFTREEELQIYIYENGLSIEFEAVCENLAGLVSTESFIVNRNDETLNVEIIKPTENQFIAENEFELEVHTNLKDKCEYTIYNSEGEQVQSSRIMNYSPWSAGETNHTRTITELEDGEYLLEIECDRDFEGNQVKTIEFVLDTREFGARIYSPRPNIDSIQHAFATNKVFDMQLQLNRPATCRYGVSTVQNRDNQDALMSEYQTFGPQTQFNTVSQEGQGFIATRQGFNINIIQEDYKGDGTDDPLFIEFQTICLFEGEYFIRDFFVGSDNSVLQKIDYSADNITSPINLNTQALIEMSKLSICELSHEDEAFEITNSVDAQLVSDFKRNHEFEITFTDGREQLEDEYDGEYTNFVLECEDLAGNTINEQIQIGISLIPQDVIIDLPSSTVIRPTILS
ncbi:MAG: LamG-like jellyroll fold domain-containing protein [Candidatus Woesearchaeota archaeon]